jgi:hypothetical protein
MDLAESNICGFRSTSHPVTDLNARNWTGSAVNCHLPLAADVGSYYDNVSRAWIKSSDHTNLMYCGLQAGGAQTGSAQSWVDHYGNGLFFSSVSSLPSCMDGADYSLCHYGSGESIDTTQDYSVHVTFDWSSQGYLNAFTTTLSQASNNLTITRKTAPNAANVPVLGAFPANGHIALLVQLWTSTDMTWLAGESRLLCPKLRLFQLCAGPDCKFTNGVSPGLPSVDNATSAIMPWCQAAPPLAHMHATQVHFEEYSHN